MLVAFNLRAVAWANQRLQTVRAGEILFVDELGPLEFERGEGFQQALALLDSGNYEEAFVVVRLSLLDLAFKRWPGARLLRLGERLP